MAPRVALICHEEDRLVREGMSAWLASSFELVGVVSLRERADATWRRVKNEWRRSGLLGFLDVLAFRLYYRLRLVRDDARWDEQQLARLRARYPAAPGTAATLVTTSANTAAVRDFLRQRRPDLIVACCKVLLKREIFGIPAFGTFVLHPGICPEYRNAHGCFWALVRRDLGRVGMTLLRVDEGVDTGPIFLQASYAFDEARESPLVIQRRVVLENLDRIENALNAICQGRAQPLAVDGRASAAWGQPRLSAYLRWKSAAHRRLAYRDATP